LPVGNDVVDLGDPETRPEATHPRFDARVFDEGERRALGESSAQGRLRWTFWAAKESAFKAARKLDPDVRFLPRRFSVHLLDDVRAEVRHRIGRFHVWLEEAQDWVHATAAPAARGRRPPGFRVERLEQAGFDASQRARDLALEILAPIVPGASDAARIVTSGGIPELRDGERRLPVDLSLSHHGRMVACAWAEED
jgi:phosphopantetheinyl transferase (holo-ACP synthase)